MKRTNRIVSMVLSFSMILSIAGFARGQSSASDTVTDTITVDDTGVTGTAYTSWDLNDSASGAEYSGISSKNYGAIQMNGAKSPGIVTTVSGGEAVSVEVDWNMQNTNAKAYIVFYGKDTPYESPLDLDDLDTRGEYLGSLVKGETRSDLDFYDAPRYRYIGIRPGGSGAMYLNSISITWENKSYDPEWTWADDFGSASAYFEASDETLAATVTSKVSKAATDIEEGEMEYTASVTYRGMEFTNVKTKVIPAGIFEDDVPYVDEEGKLNYHRARVITGKMTDIGSGWFVVKENILLSRLDSNGSVNLIVCDGVTVTLSGGITANDDITVYGQTEGTGTLKATGSLFLRAPDITINGGAFTGTLQDNDCSLIAATDAGLGGDLVINRGTFNACKLRGGGSVTINGGTINAIRNDYENAIESSYGDININGGKISSADAIGANGTVNIDISDPVDSLYSVSYKSYDGSGEENVNILHDLIDSEGNIYGEGLHPCSELAGKTLTPYYENSQCAGLSLSLEGDIGINCYMGLSEEILNSDNAFVLFYSSDDLYTEIYVKDVKDSPKTIGQNTLYVFKLNVNAPRMSSPITAQLYDNNHRRVGEPFTFTVSDYAKYLIDHSNENAEFKKAVPLVKAMLNYGTAAETYFDFDYYEPANSVLSPGERTYGDVTKSMVESHKTVVTGTAPEGCGFYGSALHLESKTSYRFFFYDQINGFTVRDSLGREIKNYQKGWSQGMFYIEIQNIFANNLDIDYTITIGDYSVTSGPMSYVYAVLDKFGSDPGKVELCDVVRSLYTYSTEADDYMGE